MLRAKLCIQKVTKKRQIAMNNKDIALPISKDILQQLEQGIQDKNDEDNSTVSMTCRKTDRSI